MKRTIFWMVSCQSVPVVASPSSLQKRARGRGSPNKVKLKSMKKKLTPEKAERADDQQVREIGILPSLTLDVADNSLPQNPSTLINSWTTHYLVAAASPITKMRGGGVGSPGGLTRLGAGRQASHSVFGMSSSDYTYCKRRDPALNSKVLQMIAARRPNTSGGRRTERGAEEWGTGSGRRPGTAGGGGGGGKKIIMTKEQQANTIKRLAEYHVEKFVPKEKSMGEMRGGKQIAYSKVSLGEAGGGQGRRGEVGRSF